MSQRFAREKGRRYRRALYPDNRPARTYDHSFYLMDGAGCLRLALHFYRERSKTLAICPTWSPTPAKAAALERLTQARFTHPKIGELLP